MKKNSLLNLHLSSKNALIFLIFQIKGIRPLRKLETETNCFVDTVLESRTVFVANKAAAADPWSAEKISHLVLLLQGAIAAYNKVGIMLNVRREHLDAVLNALPALKNPTISTLSDPDWVAINTIVDEDVVRHLIPRLKAAQAQGIVEYPLNKIVL